MRALSSGYAVPSISGHEVLPDFRRLGQGIYMSRVLARRGACDWSAGCGSRTRDRRSRVHGGRLSGLWPALLRRFRSQTLVYGRPGSEVNLQHSMGQRTAAQGTDSCIFLKMESVWLKIGL